jgi:maltooligosyltrehalose trehalohydrolase
MFTGERNWYYASFGKMKRLIDALQASHAPQERMPKKKPAVLMHQIEPSKLVVFSQNHDQIGNRPHGERLVALAGVEAAKLAAALVIFSENTPLLFMGEEYGEVAPFLFFTDYSDKVLIDAVRTGRKKEFRQIGWKATGFDPQNQSSFLYSKMDWEKRFSDKGKAILGYYQNLFRLRKTLLSNQIKASTESFFSEGEALLVLQRQIPNTTQVFIANFSRQDYKYKFPLEAGSFAKVLDSADTAWAGPGSNLSDQAKFGEELALRPLSVAVYVNPK